MQVPAARGNNDIPAFGSPVRAAFALERDYTHLNHGSYGATPVSVLADQRVWQDRLEREPSRFMDREFRPGLRAAAAALAPRIGADADGIAMVENATGAVNAVLRGLGLAPGSDILVTDQTYPAVRNTADYVASRCGAKVRALSLPFPGSDTDDILLRFKAALNPAPALVILDHVTSPTALVLPVAEMAKAAREAGALVLIDGAHAPGMLSLDISSLDCDWYTGNCHKWMFAAKGCAFLWTAPEHRASTHPLVISHGYSDGYIDEFDWVGTRDASAQLSLPAALSFMDAYGTDNIRRYNTELANRAADLLAAAWNTERGSGQALTGSMATIRLPDGLGDSQQDADTLRADLVDHDRIQVPIRYMAGGLWCRISAQIYNDVTEYENLAQAIERRAAGTT
ncbi:aminotransferase class V-fold PLP-dependent enzyme [Nisaea nitritireducens]|uniref:aminotransferase class V-fold PLP-dependent enzyme n=1 Tax=Nisaea nitritireducens TaxID=568392 RepID=UPI0018680361|nr:aminotransferase class V-fold PLP-dependent enzyme [Nisaea nitritireducens]